MWGHYGHSTHDSLPWFAYLKEMTAHDPTIQYILLDFARAKDIITTLDPEFAKNRVVWVKVGELTVVRGNVITLRNVESNHDNNPRYMDFLRLWSVKGRDRSSARNKVIYYDRRNPLDTQLSRVIRPDVENQMLLMIQNALKRYGRKEELVIFNGLHPNGTRMSAEDQFLLFKDATTVIGPHGSGMSGNLLWTNPFPRNCEDRIKVLEIFGGGDTANETSPNGAMASIITHWNFMRGWPFDYHHMMYAPGSTHNATLVDLRDFGEALDAMLARVQVQ